MQEMETTDLVVKNLRALRKPNLLSKQESIERAKMVLRSMGYTEEQAERHAIKFVKEVEAHFAAKDGGSNE